MVTARREFRRQREKLNEKTQEAITKEQNDSTLLERVADLDEDEGEVASDPSGEERRMRIRRSDVKTTLRNPVTEPEVLPVIANERVSVCTCVCERERV